MMDVSKFCCKPPNPPPSVVHAPQKQAPLPAEQHNPVVLYVQQQQQQQQQGGGGGAFPAPPPPAPLQHAGDFQYHQQYSQQQQQQPPPYPLQQGYGYQNNDFYSPQHVRSKQKQHVPTSCTPSNSIYSSSKVNIFQNYYHQYNEAENKDMQEQTHTGYVATVTAVAGGSPNGNVSSSSYFSSNSSSPSASCLTPRSTSRCDSARSAESSCSSTDSGVEMSQQLLQLSSFSSPVCTTVASTHSATPPNLVFVQQQQQARHVAATSHVPCTPPPLAPAPPTDIAVPSGWRRLLVNNTIVYVSPSGAELCSRDALRQYLCTTGTCKCGLECPLHLDRIFSFDPKVTNRAWPLITEPSELTRLCNHKRKQASLTAGPRRSPLHRNLHPDPAKECTAAAQQVGHTRRRRRKNHGPYDGVLVSQLLAQRDRLVQHPPSVPTLPPPPPLQQHNKDSMPPRVSEANSYPMWRFQGWDGVNQMHQLPPPSLPPQQPQQLQFPPPPPPPQQHQQQLRPPCHPMVPNMPSQQQQQQFRHYSPVVTTSNNVVDPRVQQQQQHKPQQQVMYGQFGDPMAKQRPPPPPYMYNTPGFNNYQPQQQQQQAPMVVNNQQPATPQWNSPCQGMYDREVPLHRLSWDDVSKRKKLKTSKRVKLNNQCPNVDVRHIPMESPKLPPQQPEVQQQPMSFPPPQPVEQNLPSFMEDPNGYLAQQTALLNSTILRQTGVNVMRPVTSLESSPSCSSPLSTVVPLPSNVIVSSKGRGTPHNSPPVIFSQANSVSSSYTSQPLSLPDSASECQACSMNNAVAALYQAATVKADVVLSPPEENPVTSSTLTQDKASPTPDPKGPIQGGTVSTSEVASLKLETESPSSSAECDKCPCEVTTVGSGHTVSSNTVTSVQAGRAQTVTVTVSTPTSSAVTTSPPTFPVTVTKSPLEMVQSVVSSIQVPPPPMQQQQPQQQAQIKLENGILDHNQLLKSGLPPGHILVSSNGQLIMATQPQKLQPPVSTSQMIPTMNMGQPMVQLVNTLPCNTPLLLQSGMIPQTVTVEGMGSPLQLTLTGNVLHQGQLTPDMGGADLLGMGHKKKGKKRSKSSPQQQQQQNVASMLQLHNSPMLMQNFQTIPTQQQAPLLQTVTILPNNKTQFLQFPTTNQQQGSGSQQSPQQQAQQQFGNIGGHLLTSPQNSINLIQPFNLLNSAGGFMPNFPLQQILQGGTTLVMPSLQGLQGMVTLPDGTLVSPDPNHGTVQLQLQNVNGQQVLTSVQSQNMFGAQQNLIATPGMVIRAPAPQTQVISNKITNQVISQNGQLISPQSQFLVNGAFTQQTALNGLMVNTGQQVTLTPQNSSPNQNTTLRGPDFIQCMNMNGQPMIIPCSSSQATVPTSQPQQNPAAAAAAATLLQQNTTIVQQQTTLVANNQQNNTTNAIMNPNFILNSNLLPKPFQELAMPLLLQKHSVSTQTAGAQTQTMVPGMASVPVTQVATLALSSPPDTTTHQAPADTTTSSPLCESMKPGTPTADFVSSTEPDPETYAWANRTLAALTAEEEVESSTKQPATEEKRSVSCKRKHSDLLVIEARPEPTQELEDPDSVQSSGPRNLAVGDLVWGPARGFPSWPGKLVALETAPTETTAASPSSPLSERMVWVRWFGDVTTPSQVQLRLLKTLSEGLEAHHRATKKLRKGRKMNSQLESAIQEAMTDLDLMTKLTGTNEASTTTSNPRSCSKKATR